MRTPTTPILSIVAPCYNEEAVIGEFASRMTRAARAAAPDGFELILVDDGSRDRTWELISALSAADPAIVGVRLMRNHGHQLAATAGLAVSRGNRVLLIDADLQDPPELLLMMMTIMDGGADVVYGQRASRTGESWFKLATASAFYRLLSRLASVPIPRDTGDFRLMSRRVVDIFLTMPERDRFIRGMVSWIGGRQVPLAYQRDARFAGETHYPFRKMVRFAVDAITSFSTMPLKLATWAGLATAAIAFALLLYTVVAWMGGHTVTGWSSLMVAITGFASIQFLLTGIIGEYLGRLVQEGKHRPAYMIDGLMQGGSFHEADGTLSGLTPQARRDRISALLARNSEVAQTQAPAQKVAR